MELTKLRKEASTKARLAMIEDFKDVVCSVVEKGEFERKLLDKLVHKVETPFKHKQGGFKTVVHGKESACVNLLTISAVNSFLSDKRRADKLSREAAKEHMKNC